MATPSYRLAAAVTAASSAEVLLVRQLPPPSPPEYRRYADSDLYDLPSAPLRRLAADEEPSRPGAAVAGGAEDGRLDLSRLDVPAALDQVTVVTR